MLNIYLNIHNQHAYHSNDQNLKKLKIQKTIPTIKLYLHTFKWFPLKWLIKANPPFIYDDNELCFSLNPRVLFNRNTGHLKPGTNAAYYTKKYNTKNT